jgi:hypothetical protein
MPAVRLDHEAMVTHPCNVVTNVALDSAVTICDTPDDSHLLNGCQLLNLLTLILSTGRLGIEANIDIVGAGFSNP